jgi:cobalamin biosynthesis protein CbiG
VAVGDGASGRAVLGSGARACVPEEDLDRAIDDALAAAGLSPADVGVLATLDRRAREAAVQPSPGGAAGAFSPCAPDELAARAVPHPSDKVAGRVATSSVAEAAALVAGGELVLPKRVYPRVTVAIARGLARQRPAARR